MEAKLYKITIGKRDMLVLSVDAADALEGLESRSGTRSMELVGKAEFSVNEAVNITRYRLRATNHDKGYGQNAIISPGIRAVIAQDKSQSNKVTVLSKNENNAPAQKKMRQQGYKTRKSTKRSEHKKYEKPLNPKFFISTKSLGTN